VPIFSDILDVYCKAARWIPLAIDPFIDLDTVFYAGMEQSEEYVTAIHLFTSIDF